MTLMCKNPALARLCAPGRERTGVAVFATLTKTTTIKS